MDKENSLKNTNWKDYLKSLFVSSDTIPATVNLTATELWSLRKELLTQLVADQLVESKDASLKMQIPPGKIIVNDQELKTALYPKYTEILERYKVYPGVNRQIRIDEEAMEVGDVVNNSVEGSWITFSEDMIEEKEKEVVSKNTNTVNLDVTELTSLRKTLLTHLLEDRLIKNKKSKVKMEIPGGKIILNGKKLNASLYAKYTDILEQYKIYSGLDRQVRMDSKIIEAGDFGKNSVKGSWVKVSN